MVGASFRNQPDLTQRSPAGEDQITWPDHLSFETRGVFLRNENESLSDESGQVRRKIAPTDYRYTFRDAVLRADTRAEWSRYAGGGLTRLNIVDSKRLPGCRESASQVPPSSNTSMLSATSSSN